jgi:hypothetical protein
MGLFTFKFPNHTEQTPPEETLVEQTKPQTEVPVETEHERGFFPFISRLYTRTTETVSQNLFQKNESGNRSIEPEQQQKAQDIIENTSVRAQILNYTAKKWKGIDWKELGTTSLISGTSGAIKVGFGISGGWMTSALFGAVTGGTKKGWSEYQKIRKEDDIVQQDVVPSVYNQIQDLGESIDESEKTLSGLRKALKKKIKEKQDSLAYSITLEDTQHALGMTKDFLTILDRATENEAPYIFDEIKACKLISKGMRYENRDALIVELQTLLSFLSNHREKIINTKASEQILKSIQERIAPEKIDRERLKRIAKATAVGAAVGAVSAGVLGMLAEKLDLHGVLSKGASRAWGIMKDYFGGHELVAPLAEPLIIGSAAPDLSKIMAYDFTQGNINPVSHFVGQTGIARDAIKSFLDIQNIEDVSLEQQVFMEDTLRLKLEKGAKKLTGSMINEVYESAKNLSQSQLQNLEQYTKFISHEEVDFMQTIAPEKEIQEKFAELFSQAIVNEK